MRSPALRISLRKFRALFVEHFTALVRERFGEALEDAQAARAGRDRRPTSMTRIPRLAAIDLRLELRQVFDARQQQRAGSRTDGDHARRAR